MTGAEPRLWVWRHPRPQGAQGRCIGRTDLPVDHRRAKRLAHRIRQQARRHGLPRRVLTSPLQRCAAVGRWLARWGWQHDTLPALTEMDFGQWDGVPWPSIPRQQVDTWCADFLHHRPGGGESLHCLFDRVAAWRAPAGQVTIVGHAGWMLARQWLATGQAWPTVAKDWPAAPPYGTFRQLACGPPHEAGDAAGSAS